MKSLGRGLDALIPAHPEKDGERPDQNKKRGVATTHEDVLLAQERMHEPVHAISYHDGMLGMNFWEEVGVSAAPRTVLAKSSLITPARHQAPTARLTSDHTMRARPPQPEPRPAEPTQMAKNKGGRPTLEETASRKPPESIYWIEIDKIVNNPYQPRREFNPEALQQLANSIKMYGILEPLLAYKHEEETPTGLKVRYELIAGERRLRASRIAGLREVPVIIRRGEESNRLKLELAIIENVQREDLNAIERALAFRQLAEEFKLSHREIAEKIGKSREYVSNSLRLLTLPENIQDSIKYGKLSEGHGRAILTAGNHVAQAELLEEILSGGLNVRETELAARAKTGHRDMPQRRDVTLLDHASRSWQKQLEEKLGTRVSLQKLDGGKGKIIVEFYSEEELQSILGKMIPEQ